MDNFCMYTHQNGEKYVECFLLAKKKSLYIYLQNDMKNVYKNIEVYRKMRQSRFSPS